MTETMTPQPKLWTKPEAAAYFGISQRTLQKRVNDGSVRAIKFGRRVLFDPADLKACAEAHKTGGPHGIGDQ
jgi:excisionase family DNA binding protein